MANFRTLKNRGLHFLALRLRILGLRAWYTNFQLAPQELGLRASYTNFVGTPRIKPQSLVYQLSVGTPILRGQGPGLGVQGAPHFARHRSQQIVSTLTRKCFNLQKSTEDSICLELESILSGVQNSFWLNHKCTSEWVMPFLVFYVMLILPIFPIVFITYQTITFQTLMSV